MLTHGQIVRLIFGLKLRELRQERGLTPAELARACDMSVSYLNEIEKGKKYPKADKILSLSKCLDVRYDQLTATTLPRRLEPIADLLSSKVLQEFPLAMYGIEPAQLFDMLANAPAKMNAFISTIFEIARNYELRQEHFFVAALRSYQEMHDNYFEDLEQDARAFMAGHQLTPGPPASLEALEAVLVQEYGYTLDRTTLAANPVAVAGRLRSVFRPQTKTLLLLASLTRGQQAFVLGREIGFSYLKLKERHYASPNTLELRSFEEVLNNFRASYFASALLMEEEGLVRDLAKVVGAKKWQPAAFLALLTRYDVSAEMLLQRLAALLPKHFGLTSLFFLRFDQRQAGADFDLTKELHLSRLHNPHRNELHEHYCRRWASLGLLTEARAAAALTGTAATKVGTVATGLGTVATGPGTAVTGLGTAATGLGTAAAGLGTVATKTGTVVAQAGAAAALPTTLLTVQRSRYLGTDDEYFSLTLARAGAPDSPAMSVTIGLRCDEVLQQQFKFLADLSAFPLTIVNETCERCPLTDCQERAAPPVQVQRAARRAAYEAAVAALVAG